MKFLTRKASVFLLSTLLVGAFFASELIWSQSTSYWTEQSASEKKSMQLKADLLNESIVALANKFSPAVVTVLTTSDVSVPSMMQSDDIFEFFFGMPPNGFGGRRPQRPQTRKAQSLGSGFVIHPDGLIVTNSHVVRMGGDKLADSVKVKFLGDSEKNEGVDVEVVGVDPIVDTAILRLKVKPKKPLAVIPFGDSDKLKVGEWVMAIGNPHGLSHTVTKGIVSALGRDILPEISADFIQTDASINQGNSGGPLISMTGEVIGVNTAIDPRGQGLGFAIPINTAKRAIRDLLSKGKAVHGYAGVSLYPNFDLETAKSLGLKSAEGALIEDVVQGEAASKAGLQSYDVVTKVGERKVSTNTDFQKAVRELDPGTTVKVEYLREGKTRVAQLTLGDLEKGLMAATGESFQRRRSSPSRPGSLTPLSRAGIEVAELSPEIRSRWGIASDIRGVVVSEVIMGSPADRAGLSRGDIILEIQRNKIVNVNDAQKMLSKKGSYLIKVLRGPTVTLFTLKV
ncbi:MAG: trypsin-like peptidase domain-containing protein [Bdellovibrionota bacterium]